VFSDKTGTLTENQMDFMSCSVNGITYSKEDLNLAMVCVNYYFYPITSSDYIYLY